MSGTTQPGTPPPTNATFSLSTLEQALVAGTGAGATAALAGEFGPLDAAMKAIAIVALGIVAVLGYRHVTRA